MTGSEMFNRRLRIGTLWWSPFAGDGEATLTAAYDHLSTLARVDALQDCLAMLQDEYDRALGAFLAELEEMVRSPDEAERGQETLAARDWKPIASAPRDGRLIVFAQPASPPYWLIGHARAVAIPSGGWISGEGILVQPTHWLPVGGANGPNL